VASLSQGRTAVAQCGLFTHRSVPVIFEPSCILRIGGWEGPRTGMDIWKQYTGIFLTPAENGNPFSVVHLWSLVKMPTDLP